MYEPRPQFLRFHHRNERWACLVCHRRAGKTVACIGELLTRALASSKPSPRYAYIAPFLKQAKAVAWQYLLEYSASIRVNKNEAELWVELPNGARITIYGADNPDAIRGIYLDGIVLDEFADMRPSFWGAIIRPLLADRKGWCVFIGTPKGHNAFYDIYQSSKGEDGWFSLMLRASESGLLDVGELDDARRSMSEDQYNQEFECSFEAAIVGAIYGKEMGIMRAQNRICKVPYNPAFEVHTAWDIGGDGTSIWFYQEVGKEPRLIDLYEATGSQLSDEVKELKERKYNYGAHVLPHDAGHASVRTGMTMKKQLEQLGLTNLVVLPRDDIEPGINLVKPLLAQLWIDEEKCQSGIEALINYQRKWDEERRVFSKIPLHNWASHTSDALRYLAIWLSRRKAPIIEPPKLGYTVSVFEGHGQGWMA